MFRFCCALLILGCVSATGWAGEIPDEDFKKQADFRKAYNNKEANEQVKALDLLAGSKHPSTWDILITVVNVNPSKAVRLAAFKLLCPMPARNIKLAQTLVALFEAVKPSDIEARIAYAKEMANSEFKYPVYEALVEYGSKLRYPDLVTGFRQGGGTGDPNQVLRRQRKEFEDYVDAFNEVTGAKLKAHDKASPREFTTWWNENKNRFLTADKEKLAKYEAEAVAERAKLENPLLPKNTAKKAQ